MGTEPYDQQITNKTEFPVNNDWAKVLIKGMSTSIYDRVEIRLAHTCQFHNDGDFEKTTIHTIDLTEAVQRHMDIYSLTVLFILNLLYPFICLDVLS